MDEDVQGAAARWHEAQRRDDMDWHGFTLWLEDDPRHRTAYDEIALLDERIERALPRLPRAPEVARVARGGRGIRFAGWGAAAAVVLGVVGVGVLQRPRGDSAPVTIAYHAPPGRMRTVELAGGATVALAPGSTLRAQGGGRGPVVLEGSGYFDVKHDPRRPLVVRAGGYEIRDVGTRFEVGTAPGMLRVAVAEGTVAVRSAGVAGEVEVAAGRSLVAYGISGEVELQAVRTQGVGSWRKGPLVYDGAPLGLVAADISRYVGRPIGVDPGVERRRFSGVIAPGGRDAMVATLVELTGLHARIEGEAVRLGARR